MRKACLPPTLLTLALAGVVIPGFAMSAGPALSELSEEELSYVSGQDGLTYDITAPQIRAVEYTVTTDAGVNAGGILAETLRMAHPDCAPPATTPPCGNMNASWTLDAATGTDGRPAISIIGQMDRIRLGGDPGKGWISRLQVDPGNIGDADRTFGEWALVTDTTFRLVGQPLLSGGKADLFLQYTDGTLFWRQNPDHATLAVDKINFLWKTDQGDVHLDNEGLRLAATETEFRIRFDAFFKSATLPDIVNDMTNVTADYRPGIRYSWGGTLHDSLFYLRPGGIWNTASNQATNVTFDNAGLLVNKPAGMSSGVNLGMRWNYRANGSSTPGDFLWSIGHITGDQEALEFGDWRNLEQATGAVPNRYGYDIPLLVYDALSAGSATNAGGSLCWGNTMTGAACGSGGGSLLTLRAGTVAGYTSEVNRSGGALFMQAIRNGNLLAWSNRVRVKHIDTLGNTVYEDTSGFGGNNDGTGYSWGLVSTLANINANVYFYPGGSETSGVGNRQQGAMGDVLFMSQSFGDWKTNNTGLSGTCNPTTGAGCENTERWSKGSHFLIADTAAQMGIGILGGSVLFAADDIRLWLRDTTANTSPGNTTGGIDLFSPRVRYNLKGLFGGARLPRGHDLIRVANADMNLEGLLSFRISPSPTNKQSGKSDESNDYLAFSAAVRLRCGSITPFGCNANSGWAGDNVYADSTGSLTASGQGSYFALEEPGKPGVDLRLADLQGDLAYTEGVLQMRAAADTNADTAPGVGNKFSSTRADLSLGSKILYGASAAPRLMDGVTGASLGEGGPAGRPVTSNIRFGGNDILSMAIPAGSAYYSLTLRAQ